MKVTTHGFILALTAIVCFVGILLYATSVGQSPTLCGEWSGEKGIKFFYTTQSVPNSNCGGKAP